MVTVFHSSAQSNWEVGLRFGEPTVAIDATIPLSASPRLHAAAYFSDYGGSDFRSDFGLGGYFDWMFSLQGGPTGLKFYPGVGPEFWFGDEFNFGVAGDFGVEYSFDFPLTVAFDWRPGLYVTNDLGFRGNNVGVSARFRFGEGVRFQRE
jgi:hypothetical protein